MNVSDLFWVAIAALPAVAVIAWLLQANFD